jgi:hypothetical protein
MPIVSTRRRSTMAATASSCWRSPIVGRPQQAGGEQEREREREGRGELGRPGAARCRKPGEYHGDGHDERHARRSVDEPVDLHVRVRARVPPAERSRDRLEQEGLVRRPP